MIHRLKTGPAVEPVSLADMREHLGIIQDEDTSRDNVLSGRIISARQWAEHYTRLAFVTQSWICASVDFPYNPDEFSAIRLKGPMQSVTSIKYTDSDGTQLTLSSANYWVSVTSGVVCPAYAVNWPETRSKLDSVMIEYVCGYGNAADVPEAIKEAIRFIVGQWEVFQSSIEGVTRPFTIPHAAKQLLEPYVDLREAFA